MNPNTPSSARTIRWSDLPEVPCTVLVSVSRSDKAEGSFLDAMERGRVRADLTDFGGRDGRGKRNEYVLTAGRPERIRSALASVEGGVKPKILEFGLNPANRSYQADMVALASWPEKLVEAMGERYELERHRRKAPFHGRPYTHWTPMEFYDYFYMGAMLLPSRMVKSLGSLLK